jgi:predicted TIM-barrel fold metal-dependent hydrolase
MDQDGWDCHIHVFDDRPTAGHYAPPPSSLPMVEAAAARMAVRRFVLVQPSVYGCDNALLLDTLRSSGGRHRGVVVVDGDVGEEDLHAMHGAGVRGIRFNIVSPVGNSSGAFARLAPMLRELGWHVQWHMKPNHLRMIADLHEASGVTPVLDHLAGFTPGVRSGDTAWQDLSRVVDQGGWIKVSGLYRLESVAPFDDMREVIARASSMFEGRCVWGSDWPHTFFHEAPKRPVPNYETVWRVVTEAIGAASADAVLRINPPALYE